MYTAQKQVPVVHGYILMTIGSDFLFWNQNFCLQIKKSQERLTVVYITENDRTVCYFNKVRYLFGMNNQLTLPRTERLFYFKITWIETSDITLHSGECKSGPCSGISLLFSGCL